MTKSNLEILAYEDTPLGPLCLRRRNVLSLPGTSVTEVTLNHEFLMSSLYTDSEQALARIGIDMHGGSDLQVMVAGLGLGYTAEQALRSDRVAAVEVVELLPEVLDWMKQGLVPLSPILANHPQLAVTLGDAYQRLAETPQSTFDLILIDVDHSPEDRLGDGQSFSFYTREGLQAACHHLNQGGVLAVWSYAEDSPFADALRDVFLEVRVEPVTHHNEMVDEHHTDWLFFARGPK